MGGYFSTRWGAEHTRQDTGGLLRLDLADLRRLGAFTPGALCSVQWTDGRGDDAGSILTRMQPTGDALTLRYSVRASDDDEWQPISEQIDLEATPCHYGSSRLWLICPTCQSRRRVLYSLGGRFRCRQCHNLAYTSTRDDAHDRSLRRIRKLQKRLGSTTSELFEVPPKPPGMHWDTYEGIASQLMQENRKRMRLLIAQREALIERLDRRMS